MEDRIAEISKHNQQLRESIRDAEWAGNVHEGMRGVLAMTHELNAHLVKLSTL